MNEHSFIFHDSMKIGKPAVDLFPKGSQASSISVMNDHTSDVVVVGCGLTGLVVASLLRRRNHRVTVVDCESSLNQGALVLTPPAEDVLSDLGWIDLLSDTPGAERHVGIELRGHCESVRLDDEWRALMLPMAEGMARITAAARDLGVEVLTDHVVVVPVWHERRVVGIRVRDADGLDGTLNAKVVVDASGSRAFLASALGHLLPRRGSRRTCVVATTAGESETQATLMIRQGSWLLWHPVTPPMGRAVVRRTTDDDDDAQTYTADWLRAETMVGDDADVEASVVAPRVGAHLRARAGEGWVAVGEAAGCGGPGLPGVIATSLVQAACVAWEIDLTLSRGRPVSSGQLGATVALASRVTQMESILDRSLARAAATGRLASAIATPRRRRMLGGMLEGNWGTPSGSLLRMMYLWWLDWHTRTARARFGEKPWLGSSQHENRRDPQE